MRYFYVALTVLNFLFAGPSFAFQDITLIEKAQKLLQESQSLLQAGNTAQAHKRIQEARQLQITMADQFRQQGQNLIQQGNVQAAQEAFEQAIEHNYLDPLTHLELGKIYLHQKKYPSALNHLSQSLQIQPNQERTYALLEQAAHAHFKHGYRRTFKNYTFPYQATAFHESDSLRIEISYALPKIGLTRSGGVGVVYLDQAFTFQTPSDIISKQIQKDRLPEYGRTVIEQNYYLATQTIRTPTNVTQLQLQIRDTNLGSMGQIETPLTTPAHPFQFAISPPLLAQSISARTDHPQKRSDLDIIPNPLRIYQSHTPVYVYLELYNLLPSAWGQTDFELSYQIQWPEETEIKPHLFEALHTHLTEDLPPELLPLQYFIPYKHRQSLMVDRKSTFESTTRITIPYQGTQSNDLTYLEIDISHLPKGVHKLILTGKDLIAQETVTHTTLFRIVQ